jgi:hypothetical protein
MRRGTSPGNEPATPDGFDPKVHAAVTDLHTYVLLLDAELDGLGERIEKLARDCPGSDERTELDKLRTELAEELEALRATAAALHGYRG